MIYVDVTGSIINPYYFQYVYNNTVYTYDDTLGRFFKSVSYKSIEDFNRIKSNLKIGRTVPYSVLKALNILKSKLS